MKILFLVLLVTGGVLLSLKLFVLYYETHFLFFPSRVIDRRPASIGLDAREWLIEAEDGVRLSAWWFPGEPDRPAILVLHGNAGNISSRLHLAEGFRGLGWSVCLLDYRGYGESEGTPSEDGINRDGEAAFRRILAEGFPVDRIVLYGESLGGTVATHLAARHPEVAGLILDATLTSAREMSGLIIPVIPFGPFLSVRLDSLGRMPRITAPTIIFHGERDRVIPIAMGRRLHEAAAGPKRFLPVPDADHCEAPFVLGAAFFQEAATVLTRFE
jgi:hypothetical protein